MKTDAKVSSHSHQCAVIFTGGDCAVSLLDPDVLNCADALIIAADSGYRTALRAGVRPDILLGDMDSIGFLPEAALQAGEMEIFTANPVKDDTDTMLAVRTAVARGARDIRIVGGTGGRCDHAISNFFLLEALHNAGIAALLTDGANTIRILGAGQLRIERRGYRYFSLLSPDRCTVTVTGCKYPLENATLIRTCPYAVSNEISDDAPFATLTIQTGTVFLIESEKITPP